MRLSDLLENADDELIARIRAMARRDVVPIFNPRPRDIRDVMRAFLDHDGSIVAAWPRSSMITHAEMGDYHGGSMRTISPLAKNINNCVSVRPPIVAKGEKSLMVRNDNHLDNSWQPLAAYMARHGKNMTRYQGSAEPA